MTFLFHFAATSLVILIKAGIVVMPGAKIKIALGSMRKDKPKPNTASIITVTTTLLPAIYKSLSNTPFIFLPLLHKKA